MTPTHRFQSLVAVVLGFMALGMVGPARVGAAMVAVAPDWGWNRGKVLYQAAAGEQNDVIVERSLPMGGAGPVRPDFVVIRDASATVSAGASCEAVDAHTARCRPSNADIQSVQLELGDADDRLRPSRDSGPVVANGGPGDDVLDLRGSDEIGVLDGGGGRDELYGGQFIDFLTDGDRDGAFGDAGPGPDVLDGGGGDFDTVSYGQRRKSVHVDLAGDRPAGQPGEGDVIRGIESIVGGSGRDRLAGSERDNSIAGGGGRDILRGRGGFDVFGDFDVGFVDSVVKPRALDVENGTSGDTVACGSGVLDVVWRPSSETYIGRTCKHLVVPRTLPPTFGPERHTAWGLSAYPKRHGSSMTYSVMCSSEENDDDPRWAALKCAGTVTLRDTSRQKRMLATGTIPRGHGTLVARLKFTTYGRRLAARRTGVRALLRVRGNNLPTAAWTIRLKLRR